MIPLAIRFKNFLINNKFKIFTVATSVLMLIAAHYADCAYAAITDEVVERAWSRVATADGFKVVKINYENDNSPNAWVKFKSQDDFSVHVTRGLMKILNNEDEIAGVLGHEIGHVRCGHYNEGVQRQVGWAALGAILNRVGGIAGAAGAIGANLAESGFSRKQEVEADDYGTDLLVKAGYSPWGLYNAMKCFKDNNLVTQPSGFNSHPPTERRLKHLSDRAKSIENSNSNKNESKDDKNKKAENVKNAKARKKLSKTGSRTYRK